jgi:hypothetical protein
MKIADEYKVYTEEEKKKVILHIKIFKVLSVAILYSIVLMLSIFFHSGYCSRWSACSRDRAP